MKSWQCILIVVIGLSETPAWSAPRSDLEVRNLLHRVESALSVGDEGASPGLERCRKAFSEYVPDASAFIRKYGDRSAEFDNKLIWTVSESGSSSSFLMLRFSKVSGQNEMRYEGFELKERKTFDAPTAARLTQAWLAAISAASNPIVVVADGSCTLLADERNIRLFAPEDAAEKDGQDWLKILLETVDEVYGYKKKA